MTAARRWLVALAVTAAMGLGAASPHAAQAQDLTGSFSGTAAADGVRLNVAIPDYLLIEDFVDGGGPSAQAVLDSLGVSRSYASFPYPGELGVAATGLVSTLTGLSLPSYPLIANADHPTEPERNIDQPGLHLNASSGPQASSGRAAFGETTAGGVLEGGGFSDASVTVDDDGTVVARAEARYSVVVGPVALHGVRAVAEASRTADGRVATHSEMVVAGLSLGGIELALTDRGLVLAGTPVVPIDALTGLAQALSFEGTSLRFMPETRTEDSVLSAGLEIRTTILVPAVERNVEVTMRLGNVFAAASTSPFATDAVPSLPLPDPAGPDVAGGPLDLGGPVVDLAPPRSAPELAATPAATRRRVGDQVQVSSWTFFPVLVLAGLALLAGALGERWHHTRESRGGS